MKKPALRIFLLIGILGGILATDGKQAFSKNTVLLDTCCGTATTNKSDCCAAKHASCPRFIPAARPELAILAPKTVPVFAQVVLGIIELPQSDRIVSSQFVPAYYSSILTKHRFKVSPPLRAPPASSLIA